MGAGGCFVSAPADFKTDEFQHCIATTVPKVIIAHLSVVATLPATLKDHVLLFVLDDLIDCPKNSGAYDVLGNSWKHWTQLLDRDTETTMTCLRYSSDDLARNVALICMTSGYASQIFARENVLTRFRSTGQRKAAQHSHNSLISLIENQMRALTTTRPFTRQLTTVGTLAAGHIGLTVEYLMALKARQRFLVTQARDPASIIKIIDRYQVDVSFLRPLLLDHMKSETSKINLQSLSIAYTGGIGVPQATMTAALKRLSEQALVVSFFGGTE
jgi:acyl-CoA synthetase (AMP-forming)/AMP-acid ligase II